jgi:F-type H+-transporting ATPase subunit b
MKRLTFKQLILLSVLLALLIVPVLVSAQDDTTDPEGEGDTGTEVVAEEGEAVEEESTSPLVPLGINTGLLLAQIVNFLLVFGLLTVFLWRPLRNMLDSRSTTIAKGLEDAAAAASARQNAEAEAEKILAQARAEAAKTVEEARGRGDEVAKTIEVEARAEADKIRQEARVSAEAERNSELAGLRGQVASISVAVAQRLIGETLDQKRQQALIDDFFTKVPDAAKSISGSVTVVSAMPLSDAEQKKVRSQIGADNVEFAVDPTILGGLIVRGSDRVIDGSVRTGLTELTARMN